MKKQKKTGMEWSGFLELMQNMASEFREDAYSENRFKLLFREFGHLNERLLKAAVAELIITNPSYRPPMAKELRQAISGVRDRVESEIKMEHQKNDIEAFKELNFVVPKSMLKNTKRDSK